MLVSHCEQGGNGGHSTRQFGRRVYKGGAENGDGDKNGNDDRDIGGQKQSFWLYRGHRYRYIDRGNEVSKRVPLVENSKKVKTYCLLRVENT